MRFVRLALATALLATALVHAQQAPLPQPTNTASLAWDYSPSPTELPLTAVDHFDVQWTATGPWAPAGKSLTFALPLLTAGSYAARVRACRTTDASDCIPSAPLTFTVAATGAIVPIAVPGGLRLVLATSPKPGALTYFETNFTTGLPSYLTLNQYGAGSCATSTTFKDTPTGATQSYRCAIVNDGAAAILTRFPNASRIADKPADPTLDRDFYQQYRVVFGPGSGTVTPGSANDSRQWKLHKATYGVQGSNTNGWSMITMQVGGTGLMTEPELWNNSFNPDPPFTDAAYPRFTEGQVYELVRYYRRDAAKGCGYYGLWVNGQARVHTGCLPWLGTTTGSGGEGLVLQDGAVYGQNMVGTATIYSLYMRAANFPLGGVTF